MSTSAMTRVLKFGGSSLGNAYAIGASSAVVRTMGAPTDRAVVVTSAMQGVTQMLLAVADHAQARRADQARHGVAVLRRLHRSTVDALPLSPARASALSRRIDHVCRTVLHPYVDATLDGSRCSHAHAEFVSSGETFTSMMVAATLSDAPGARAVPVPGHEVLRLDADGRIDRDATREAVRATLELLVDTGVVPCVAGFAARATCGRTVLLPRGGSDLTASALAYGVSANELLYFKVESRRHANGTLAHWLPGMVGLGSRAADGTWRTLPFATFDEALAFDRVLHADTFSVLRNTGTVCFVRNTEQPDLTGTRLTEFRSNHVPGPE